MKPFLPDEVRTRLPNIKAQESAYPNPIVYAKYFTPMSNWTWFVTEGEPRGDDDYLFFGYVIGLEEEWGYFTLREFQSCRDWVELDLNFTPAPLQEVLAKYEPLPINHRP